MSLLDALDSKEKSPDKGWSQSSILSNVECDGEVDCWPQVSTGDQESDTLTESQDPVENCVEAETVVQSEEIVECHSNINENITSSLEKATSSSQTPVSAGFTKQITFGNKVVSQIVDAPNIDNSKKAELLNKLLSTKDNNLASSIRFVGTEKGVEAQLVNSPHSSFPIKSGLTVQPTAFSGVQVNQITTKSQACVGGVVSSPQASVGVRLSALQTAAAGTVSSPQVLVGGTVSNLLGNSPRLVIPSSQQTHVIQVPQVQSSPVNQNQLSQVVIGGQQLSALLLNTQPKSPVLSAIQQVKTVNQAVSGVIVPNVTRQSQIIVNTANLGQQQVTVNTLQQNATPVKSQIGNVIISPSVNQNVQNIAQAGQKKVFMTVGGQNKYVILNQAAVDQVSKQILTTSVNSPQNITTVYPQGSIVHKQQPGRPCTNSTTPTKTNQIYSVVASPSVQVNQSPSKVSTVVSSPQVSSQQGRTITIPADQLSSPQSVFNSHAVPITSSQTSISVSTAQTKILTKCFLQSSKNVYISKNYPRGRGSGRGRAGAGRGQEDYFRENRNSNPPRLIGRQGVTTCNNLTRVSHPQQIVRTLQATPNKQFVVTTSTRQLIYKHQNSDKTNLKERLSNVVTISTPDHGNTSPALLTSAVNCTSEKDQSPSTKVNLPVSKSGTSSFSASITGGHSLSTALSNTINEAGKNEPIPVDNSQSSNFKFLKNVLYAIPMEQGHRMYRYDGKHLIPQEETEGPIRIVGGGVGDKNKTLKGNATGLHMSTQSSSSQPQGQAGAFLKAAEAVGSKVFKGGRFWNYSTGPQSAIIRRAKVRSFDIAEAEEASEQETSENEATRKREAEDLSDLPPLAEDEMRIVHCKFCGYSSTLVKSCERCHRTFPTDTKIEIHKKKFKKDFEENKESSTPITKESFYGVNRKNNVVVMNYIKPATGAGGRRINIAGKSYRSPAVIRGGKQARKSLAVEPVTISISSDEEEPETSNSVPGSTATGSVTTTTITTTSTAGDSDDFSQILNEIPVKAKRTVSPTFNNSRISKMEDTNGNPVLKRKIVTKKVPSRPSSRCSNQSDTGQLSACPDTGQSSASSDTASEQTSQRTNELAALSSLALCARSVRIGSLKASPIEPVLIAEESIEFYVECEENTHRFIIKPDELQQCLFCLKDKLVIFLRTTTEYAEKVRKMFHMSKTEGDAYFDPQDPCKQHQLITILLTEVGDTTEESLMHILNKYPRQNQGKMDFVYSMNSEEANLYLQDNYSNQANKDQSSSNAAQTEDQERSPSPPKILFTGPVVKLITYPPPPATGGIQVTNEDLACLQEGEFLNDVIIDFYLKYLFMSVLNERDRERTHIFSSFFFKRLTLRQGRYTDEDTADKTPAEKKHARVKSWTKKVDLFKKDFIIVPINEHSHWYLAIICFPGLMENKSVKYIPKKVTPLVSYSQVFVTKSPKTSNRVIEPYKSLKSYKIPKVDKSGDKTNQNEAKSDSDVAMKNVDENNSSTSGNSSAVNSACENSEESMETEDNSNQMLSEAQAAELAEQTEEMNTSPEVSQQTEEMVEGAKNDCDQENPTNPESIESTESQSQESTEDIPQSQENTETQDNEKSNGNVAQSKDGKKILGKTPMFRSMAKDIRGRELTTEEDADLSKLQYFSQGTRQPCILVFDSLSGQSRARVVAILKEYLQVEWDTKKKTPNSLKERIRGSTPRVPQQTNFSDCGVYILQYVESFFEDPIQDFAIPLRPLSDWFTDDRVAAKRDEIRELVMRLKEQQDQAKS